jgi:beta-galactosidase
MTFISGLLSIGALAIVAVVFFPVGSAQAAANPTVTLAAELPFATVQKKIEQVLAEKNIQVFSVIDHAANAKQAGMTMPPATVIVFGNPAVGTKLMLAHPAMALELPLKILIWQDAQGKVWLSYPNIKQLAVSYGAAEHPVVAGMSALLDDLAQKSIR